MTEDEAKTKWCPHVRLRNGEQEETEAQEGYLGTENGAQELDRDVDGTTVQIHRVHVSPFAAPSYNRQFFKGDDGTEIAAGCKCIGSACTAWRWSQKRNPDWKPSQSMMASGYQQHPDDASPPYITDTENGFCGLAGRP